jgi:uncharacterized protein (UPF0332 family)
MPPDRTPENLASFRLYQAKECLQSAEREFAADSFKAAANRSYYCIFHSMRAVLALERFDSRKHSGIMSAFRKDYIRNGIFPPEFSKIVNVKNQNQNCVIVDFDFDFKILTA